MQRDSVLLADLIDGSERATGLEGDDEACIRDLGAQG